MTKFERFWEENPVEVHTCTSLYYDEKYNNPDTVSNLTEDVKTCNEIFWDKNTIN